MPRHFLDQILAHILTKLYNILLYKLVYILPNIEYSSISAYLVIYLRGGTDKNFRKHQLSLGVSPLFDFRVYVSQLVNLKLDIMLDIWVMSFMLTYKTHSVQCSENFLEIFAMTN